MTACSEEDEEEVPGAPEVPSSESESEDEPQPLQQLQAADDDDEEEVGGAGGGCQVQAAGATQTVVGHKSACWIDRGWFSVSAVTPGPTGVAFSAWRHAPPGAYLDPARAPWTPAMPPVPTGVCPVPPLLAPPAGRRPDCAV